MKNFFRILFHTLFTGGILLGLLGRVICTGDNKNYAELQPESFVPDVIETVLYDESLRQIYVCYGDANCVNVYSDSGKFLWAVALPYMRNDCFELQHDKLIIYDDSIYVYSSADGEFIGCAKEDDFDLDYHWEHEITTTVAPGEIYFDTYQVYKADSDGTLETIVARPWWHWFFHFGVCLCVAFIGAIGIGILIFMEKAKAHFSISGPVEFQSKKGRNIVIYFKVTTLVQVLYAIFDIIFGFYGGILCIGIMPLAIHFIISNIVIWNMLDNIRATDDEQKEFNYWKACEMASFFVAFFSVIIAASCSSV